MNDRTYCLQPDMCSGVYPYRLANMRRVYPPAAGASAEWRFDLCASSPASPFYWQLCTRRESNISVLQCDEGREGAAPFLVYHLPTTSACGTAYCTVDVNGVRGTALYFTVHSVTVSRSSCHSTEFYCTVMKCIELLLLGISELCEHIRTRAVHLVYLFSRVRLLQIQRRRLSIPLRVRTVCNSHYNTILLFVCTSTVLNTRCEFKVAEIV